MWGSDHFHSRGHQIENLALHYNYSLLNPTGPTHYNFSYRSWSTLDLVIHSPQLNGSLFIFNHSDLAGSDHFPGIIRFTISNSESDINVRRRWNYNKTDWEKYQSDLPEDLQFDEAQEIQTFTRILTEKLVSCANSCSPEIKICKKNRAPVPWWNDDCGKAIKNRRKALQILKTQPFLGNHVNFRKLRVKAKWTIKLAKRTFWQKFVSTTYYTIYALWYFLEKNSNYRTKISFLYSYQPKTCVY